MVTDGSGTDVASSLDIEVTAVDDSFTDASENLTTPEDTALTGNVLTGTSSVDGPVSVLSATVDVDGDGTPDTLPLGVATAIVDRSGNPIGTITLNSDGTFTFTPAPDYNGPVPTIEYVVTDGSGTDVTSSLDIEVTAVDDSFTDASENLTTPEDTALTGNVLTGTSSVDGPVSVSSAAVDVDGDGTPDALPLGVATAIVDGSGNPIGTITLNSDGTFSFTPAPNYNGPVPTIEYVVTDGSGTDVTSTLDITVEEVIQEIIANDDTNAVPIYSSTGATNVLNIADNDLFDGVSIVVDDMNWGVIGGNVGGFILLDPTTGFVSIAPGTPAGTYTLTYQVCEKANPTNCDTAVLTIVVELDTDGDGIPDVDDADDDNDGIPDEEEGDGSIDTDGDGIPDSLDLDSDNDGILDVDEGGNGDLDTNGDGVIDSNDGASGVDSDGDGQADASVDANEEPDTDGDGVPDYQDLDSDNDGINDVIENGNGGLDTNGDGVIDSNDTNGGDSDGDGIPDSVDGLDGFGDNEGDTVDTDGDGVADYQDLDSDDDGVNDVVEGGNGDLDTNGDGTIDSDDDNGGDSDGDGISDSVDGLDGHGDANDPDNDSDPTDPNDGGNGVVGDSGTDSDGDGIADSVDGLDGFGDAIDEGTCVKVNNLMSPNGDSANSYLHIDCIENFSNNKLEIFNRWGNTVFKVKGYSNTNRDKRFEGISNGRVNINVDDKLPVGTYFYILDLGNGSKVRKGWIYINR
ncbi:hypothetical protein TCRASSO_50520 [Tenacibaculum crassostreae]